VRGGPCITSPIPTLQPRADLASALLGHARLARRREGGGSEEVGGDGSSEEVGGGWGCSGIVWRIMRGFYVTGFYGKAFDGKCFYEKRQAGKES